MANLISEKQHTIKQPVSFTGIGLHTGIQSTITFYPAPEDYGYRFIRTDLEEHVEIPAIVDYVVDLSRGTTLGIGDVLVHTVEHVLAALVGLGIDNCKIELSAKEPPVGDGSSIPYVSVLKEAGIIEQSAERNYFVVDETVSYTNEVKGVDYVALPTDDYRITVMIDYYNPALGSQHSGMFNLQKEFETEFAPARTFCFFTEILMLLEQGLIKGGNLNNAIVIVDKEVAQKDLETLKKKFNLPEAPTAGSTGILSDMPLRFKNEPARHKLLDLLGDLALVGVPMKAQILAARPGHANNIEFAKKLRSLYLKKQQFAKRRVVAGNGFVLDINNLMDILPHRYPFLLIDRLIEYNAEENWVIGLKNVTINEEFFQGHFPNMPIMPGVLILESMAQAGCLLLIQTLENFREKLIMFMSIKEVKFRKPVVPGDQLNIHVKLLGKKLKTYHLKGTVYVNGQVVAEAEFSTAVTDRK
jgi:UDP-3-O-[3-hydroxymyristoyl] N-acetylglucosamine deacetylase/3-hydroxyacyl-[acyl-carrier-protein] dehydratase